MDGLSDGAGADETDSQRASDTLSSPYDLDHIMNDCSFIIERNLNGCYGSVKGQGGDVNAEQLADPESVRPGEVRARGQYRKGIKRRQDIVKAASEVFAEFGYSGGSIRTIADRVGASPATLMQHFGSKEGLLAAVLEDWTGPEVTAAARPRPARPGLHQQHAGSDALPRRRTAGRSSCS